MRKFTCRLAATALALLALTGCRSSAPVQDADPALWVVRDDDTTIYLFGTVHLLKPGLSWFDEAVRDAFDKSGTLVLEVVMPDDAEMGAIIRDLGTATSGPALSDQLPPEDAKLLAEALPSIGMPANALEKTEPWLAATMIASVPLQKAGYQKAAGVESVLTAAAIKSGKQIIGLETAREQLGYFDALPLPAQRTMLIQTLRGLPKSAKTLDTAIAGWAAGDPDRIAKLLNDDATAAPEIADALLYKRNQRWADWIKARMDHPGTLFVAVGAGHLAGANNVQSELQKRGLKVERIHY